MMVRLGYALAGMAMLTGAALAAEPIEGTWKRPNGTLIKFEACGGGSYCGTVLTGQYKGQSIGSMSGSNGQYKGKINKLDEGKTYSGKASAKGSTLSLSGCVLGGIICKSETLTRQ